MKRILAEYPHIEDVLPAMGYSDEQVRDLEETIRNTDCDVVVSETPHDLARLIGVDVPIVRVRYELAEKDLTLETIIERHAETLGIES